MIDQLAFNFAQPPIAAHRARVAAGTVRPGQRLAAGPIVDVLDVDVGAGCTWLALGSGVIVEMSVDELVEVLL